MTLRMLWLIAWFSVLRLAPPSEPQQPRIKMIAQKASVSDIPIALTSFVGHEQEIAEVKRLLSSTRLVTLTGPGSCGKTRLCALVLVALAGCAPPAAMSPPATPTITSPAARPPPAKSTGKLSTRLAMLAQSPALRTASADEQAHALSLPAQGPGSLMRDADGRLLVDIRTADLSANGLQALRNAGAVITNVSERYQVVTALVAVTDLTAIANLPIVQNVQEELVPAGTGGAVFPTPP
jgi:hypothetical protein